MSSSKINDPEHRDVRGKSTLKVTLYRCKIQQFTWVHRIREFVCLLVLLLFVQIVFHIESMETKRNVKKENLHYVLSGIQMLLLYKHHVYNLFFHSIRKIQPIH